MEFVYNYVTADQQFKVLLPVEFNLIFHRRSEIARHKTEIVKHRLYRPEEFGDKARYSGQKTVYTILYKLLQDFSIFFPFITEEIYQELFHDNKSIHLTEIKPLEFSFDSEIKNGDMIIEIISQARGEKTNNNVSLKTPIRNLDIKVDADLKCAINSSIKDFKATLFIENLNLSDANEGFEVSKIELNLDEVDAK